MWRLALALALPHLAHAGGLGMAGAPTRVIAAGADGSWVVMCQARKDTDKDGVLAIRSGFNGTSGDDQHAYLVIGSGLGEQLDDFYGADPTGRRALIVRGKRVVMIQPGLGKDVDVDALGAGGTIHFDGSGERLVFSRKRAGKERIVIRELASGAERELDPGPGKLDSFYTYPGDRWMEAMVFANKPGDQPWKTTAEASHGWCWTGYGSDHIQQSGTPAVRRYLSTDGKSPARELPDLVGIAGAQLIRRRADGALTSERPGEPPRVVVPAACGGRAVGTHDGALVVACTKQGTPAPLAEYGAAGAVRAIGAAIKPSDADTTEDRGRFLLVTGRDANDTIVDLVTGKVHRSPEYQQPIWHAGDRAIVQRGEHLVAIEPAADRVLGAIAKYPATLAAGSIAYVEPLVLDRGTANVLGVAPAKKSTDPLRGDYQGTVAAVAKDGRILVGWGREHGRWAWLAGPLEWIKPVAGVTP